VIRSVEIAGFRGVQNGKVEGLAPISILVGPNNTGKSTVLEAIATVGAGSDAQRAAKLLLRRGGTPLDALAHVVRRGASTLASVGVRGVTAFESWSSAVAVGRASFRDEIEEARRQGLTDPMEPLLITASVAGDAGTATRAYVDSRGRCSTRIVERRPDGPPVGEPPAPPFPLALVDVEAVRGAGALEDAYTRIDAAGRLPLVVKALERSMPGLTDLRILKSDKPDSGFVLHTFFKAPPPVPVYLAGDGFKRFLELCSFALATPQGVVLLEEPESFQHPRYLRELATLLHLAAQGGTQIILSTHSLELIDLLLLAPEAGGQTYPAVHRLSLYEGTLRATTIDRESAVAGRESLLQDLRA
jgi:predicted ATPase